MAKRRIAVINKELWKDFSLGRVIMNVCPVNRSGEECITIDPKTKFPIIDEKLCIGCGLCVKAAEKAGCYAISIVNLPEQLEETPVHRFGVNEFVLFRLPYPITGQIVGIVGSNGIGKTTSISILSGELKPNLGKVGEDVDFEDILKLFRGKEIFDYLKKLEEKTIRTSIKPQRVDKIPKLYKGKVSKLLKNVDERGILNDLIDDLRLENILDSEIIEISGGELQRVAIAACLSRDADFYYLDEPTSFLDVFQRLLTAKIIRKYCKDRAVLIADHDLATLDFLADRIHIFYGVPGVYGIVSKPYSVRVGINTFLDGYIKEENIRFRNYPVVFSTNIIEELTSPEVLISFKNIKKSFDKFELHVMSGDVRKKEVLAVLGANALGKTTFTRIIAGEIEADEGEISGKIKISYKPQYIRTNFDGTVEHLLSTATETNKDDYKVNVLTPLNLDKLLLKDVKNLSGGELQKVAIALTFGRDADLYLLDEPSAFLDVEERLTVAKLIKKLIETKEKSALVIDHDLLFLSQLGSRGMVFLGKPGIKGYVRDVTSLKNAFNTFLSTVGVTFRRDPQTGRPRANKLDSQLDREQKEKGDYFCM